MPTPPGWEPVAAAPPGWDPRPGAVPGASPLFGESPEAMFQRSHETYEATKPRTPQERVGEILPGMLATGASMLVPPARPEAPLISRLLRGALGRIGAAEVGNTAGRAATGQGIMPSGGGAAQQALGELLFAPLGMGLKAKAANRARAGAAAEAEAIRPQYAEQVRAHGEGAAASIMDDWKKQVPALGGFPSTTRGMLDAIYGKGKELVGQKYDAALQQVVANAKGQQVPLSTRAADAFGFEAPSTNPFGMSRATAQSLQNAGRLPTSTTPDTIMVDAADLAKRMTGAWKTDPGAYRAAANALDRAGIGDPAARAEYKAYQGITQFVDKTKMLEGETLHADRGLKGLTSLKTGGELRNRGIGDIFTGPMQALRGAPPAPPKVLPRPTDADLGIRSVKNPLAGHPWIAGVGAEGLSHSLGLGQGLGVPFLLGAGASTIMPKELVTRAPLGPTAQAAQRFAPGGLGEALDLLRQRLGLTNAGPRPEAQP